MTLPLSEGAYLTPTFALLSDLKLEVYIVLVIEKP